MQNVFGMGLMQLKNVFSIAKTCYSTKKRSIQCEKIFYRKNELQNAKTCLNTKRT